MKTNYKKFSEQNLDEISWAVLVYLFLKGKIVSYTNMIFVVSIVFCAFYVFKSENAKELNVFHKIGTSMNNFLEHSRKEEASKTLSAIINIKTAVSTKITREGQNWLDNPEKVYSEKTLNHDYILFQYLDSDNDEVYSHNLEENVNNHFVQFEDGIHNPIYIGKEKEGYFIQVEDKNSVVCSNLIFPLQNLKEVLINLMPVDFNSQTDIENKCSMSQHNTIKYIFKE